MLNIVVASMPPEAVSALSAVSGPDVGAPGPGVPHDAEARSERAQVAMALGDLDFVDA